jgi:hypothetical protein
MNTPLSCSMLLELSLTGLSAVLLHCNRRMCSKWCQLSCSCCSSCLVCGLQAKQGRGRCRQTSHRLCWTCAGGSYKPVVKGRLTESMRCSRLQVLFL